jgi:hypothetical protein
MLARRDTRREASRLRRLSPLQTLENQSQTWGIRCHSCTGREGLPPSWKLSYKTYVLRFTRESKFSFNQRIARILMSSRYQPLRFCLSAIPTCRSLPLIDMLFSIPTLPHFLPKCALHEGGAAQRVSKRFVLVSWLCNRVMKRCCQG